MADPLIEFKKPGFPKIYTSEKSIQTVIDYVGELTDLETGEPAIGTVFGDYVGVVTATNLSPIEGTLYADLTVTVEEAYEPTGAGTPQEVSTEIDWVMFQRSMLEHPAFRLGGGGTYALTIDDIIDIEGWKNEPDPDLKKVYKYLGGTPEYKYEIELSANAQKFADGINLGLETYEDYAPVARKNTTYVGGPPSATEAGTKVTPTGITGLPTGYEWRKTADRSTRAGRASRWVKTEEWTGAIKVLTDKSVIYF